MYANPFVCIRLCPSPRPDKSGIKYFWSRSKNILILPDEEPETLKLAGLIRPVFITGMEDDFSKMVLILKHIKERFEMDIQKP